MSRALLVSAATAAAMAVLPVHGASAAPPAAAPPAVATLMPDGSAVAPPSAPRPVRKAINAANRIRLTPYAYGGGHRRFNAKGYDCSGAVSYVLHAAGILKRPLASGALARRWGKPGVGRWISVYAHKRHAFVMIAGLRWDTSAAGEPSLTGSGPRWRALPRSTTNYRVRHRRY